MTEIRVRELEWTEDGYAHTGLGLFYVASIQFDGEGDFWLLEKCEGSSSTKSAHPDEPAAKAFAQSDFNTRILSAILPPAPVSGNAVSDEMVEAAIEGMPGRDTIQGFYYESSDLHVIRDVTKPFSEQELWRIISPDYAAAHEAMMREIDRIMVRRSLEAALSASVAESEPVAWRYNVGDGWEVTESRREAEVRSQFIEVQPLFASPPSVEEGKAWQPIETAPKDGTKIDLWVHYHEGDQHKRVPNARWDETHQDWDFGPLMFRSKQYALPAIPTHWMPLPAGPAALSGAK